MKGGWGEVCGPRFTELVLSRLVVILNGRNRLICERLKCSPEDISLGTWLPKYDAKGKVDLHDPRLGNPLSLLAILISARATRDRSLEELARSRLSKAGIKVMFTDEMDSPSSGKGVPRG